MGYYWRTLRVGDKNKFLSDFKKRIKDIFIQRWWVNVEATSTGRLFKYIKTEFKYEPYLDNLNRPLRIALTKIRLSSHHFFIERGRWDKVDREDRVCTVCNVLEDELHCLVFCPRFVNERNGLLNVALRERPCMNEFVKVLKSVNEEDMKSIGLLCLKVLIEYSRDLFVEE